MYVVVTFGTNDQGLALVLRHASDPSWLFLSPFHVEVSEFANMMNLNRFHPFRRITNLTTVREQSLFKARASMESVGQYVRDGFGRRSSKSVAAELRCY